MRERPVDIPVGDESTQGLLRLPAERGRVPLIVHCPGWMSTKDARHYARYHDAFADHGIASLVFDYRALRPSSPGPVVDPNEMVDDAAAAVAVALEYQEVDPNRVILLGTGGVGAGVAVVTATGTTVAAAIMVSPFASGATWLESMRTPEEHRELLAQLEADRQARAAGVPPITVPPVGGVTKPPPERAQIGFKTEIRRDLPQQVALETVERLIRFRPLDYMAALSPRPLLLVACRDDVAVPYDDAVRLYAAAAEPKRLVTLEGTSSYRMHETHWRQIVAEMIQLTTEVTEQRDQHGGL